MPVDRGIWRTQFNYNYFPKLPCPRCKSGILKLEKDYRSVFEPQYSKNQHSAENWDPTFSIGRFYARLVCNNSRCGEIITMIGDAPVIEDYVENYDYGPGIELRVVLVPKAFFPPPHLINLPASLPGSVRNSMVQSFALYWVDFAACVAKIRSSIEEMLNEFKVQKRKKTVKGTLEKLTLHKRLEIFSEKYPEAGEYLMAVKWVGNIGSHEVSDVRKDLVFDVYDFVEAAFLSIYDDHKKNLVEKAKIINKTKGKKSK